VTAVPNVFDAPIQAELDWSIIRGQAAAFVTTEYASLDRAGSPVTWPVTPYLGEHTIDVSTGLTYPLKAERARRNPKVTLSFSQPVGSGLEHPATFVVQGLATVRDADLRANSARYLEVSNARFPQMYASTPTAMLRGMAFYWARIWIEVTPVRVLWWAGGDLDVAPQTWMPHTARPVSPSDPAPAGRGAGSWKTTAPVEWTARTRGALDRLGMPVLTTVTADGWPLPLRMRDADATPTGFRVRPPAGVDIVGGPASLTFHSHGEVFDSQENIALVGRSHVNADGTVDFEAQRALNDFIVPKNPIRRTIYMLSAGRRLNKRLDSEAARRGQEVPRFADLGFSKR
jgi:hypothetical protein